MQKWKANQNHSDNFGAPRLSAQRSAKMGKRKKEDILCNIKMVLIFVHRINHFILSDIILDCNIIYMEINYCNQHYTMQGKTANKQK